MSKSKRRDQVAFLATEGFSNKEIAEHLGLSVETIKTHMRRIIKDTGLPRGKLWTVFRVDKELEANAARYRYLRDDGDGFDISVREEGGEGEEWVTGYPPEELDAAVDAAIACSMGVNHA